MKIKTMSSYTESERAELESRLEILNKSKWTSILEIHKLQESVEQFINENRKLSAEISSYKERLETIKKCNPDVWEYSNLKILSGTNEDWVEIIFEDAYISESFFPKLRLVLNLAAARPTLTIEATGHLHVWSAEKKNTQELASSGSLVIELDADRAYSGGNSVLKSLSTSDWNNLLTIVRKSRRLLTPDRVDSGEHFQARCVLQNLDDMLSGWPNLLRFDKITTTAHENTGLYKSLDISLENVSFSGVSWNSLNLRIAAIGEGSNPIAHPRLEFLKGTAHGLESWYTETSDRRGERLELRYALPDEMDLFVWHKLSSNDKSLITALIFFLPDYLTRNLERHSLFVRIAAIIKKIHLFRVLGR